MWIRHLSVPLREFRLFFFFSVKPTKPFINGRFHTTVAKKALYLSVNVFSTKALIGDTINASPTGDGTAILRGHPSYAKVQPLRQYLQFSVIFKTLRIGPVPGIEPATSRSAVKRSAD